MELDDCALPPAQAHRPHVGCQRGFCRRQLGLLVGAVPRKAGMERKDLLTINGGIFTGQGRAIAENAAADVTASWWSATRATPTA